MISPKILQSEINGNRILAVGKKEAIVFDFETCAILARYNIFNDTAQRLCCNFKQNVLILGGWDEGCVAYQIGGKETWKNRKLKRFTWIRKDVQNRVILTGHEEPFAIWVDLLTGGIVKKEDGINDVHVNPDGSYQIVDYADKGIWIESLHEEASRLLRWESFAISEVAFAMKNFALASPEGHLVTYNASSGEIVGKLEGHTFSRVQKMIFSKKLNIYFAVLSEYRGLESTAFVRFNCDLSEFEVINTIMPVWDVVFLLERSKALTTSGLLLDLVTGVEDVFTFPKISSTP